MKVRSQLRLLIAQKEHQEGQRYSLRAVVNATKPYTGTGKGVPISTIQGLLNDDWNRLDRDSINALCQWLACTPGDLLKLEG
ncbi:helix-turn-helix transcriptional regulator [Chloroflexia bacterium SDU3-3]|nr:helix-turn-helix transcriptional regulator [Chloroflexia bacterium SDU3-3]